MRCKNCGFETPNNSNFCSHCGAKIDFDDNFIDQKEEIIDEPKEKMENNDIYSNIDTSKASIGWYFLGLIAPIFGLIFFFLYLYRKPDLAFKARRGALHGFIIEIILSIGFYIYLFTRGGI